MTLVVSLIILGVLIAMVLIAMVLLSKDKKAMANEAYQPVTLFNCDIKTLASRIATEDIDTKTLEKVINHVANNHVFPTKKSAKSAKDYLEFVYQFCLNKRVGGAMIVKMSNTLKTVNPDYKNEIENLEKEAVEKRDRTK